MWQRRAAKSRLTTAAAEHEGATADLHQLEQKFRPQCQERQSMLERVGELEREIAYDSILDRNTNDVGRITHLRHVVDALDTWHDWAAGGRVPGGEVRDTYAALRARLEHDWLEDDPRSQLAGILRTWADGANLSITTVRPSLRLPERELGIEMG